MKPRLRYYVDKAQADGRTVWIVLDRHSRDNPISKDTRDDARNEAQLRNARHAAELISKAEIVVDGGANAS